MKRLLMVISATLALSFLFLHAAPQTAAAADTPASQNGDKPLCLPGSGSSDATDCLALGPYQQISSLAGTGLTYPIRPLPGVKPDPSSVGQPGVDRQDQPAWH